MDSRPRRLAPISTWLALTPRATSSSPSAESWATTAWKPPPISSAATRSRSSASGATPVSPSRRLTYTASHSPPAVRDAIRAARRIRANDSGPPDTPTTTRSRVGQLPAIRC